MLQTTLEGRCPRDCNFPASMHWSRGWARDSSPLSHLLGALWHCQSRAGTGATMPHPKTQWVWPWPWPSLFLARVSPGPGGPGPEWGKGEDGQGWGAREWGNWHGEPTPRRQTACELTQTLLSLWTSFTKQKLKVDIKNFKLALTKALRPQALSLSASRALCEGAVWMPMNLALPGMDRKVVRLNEFKKEMGKNEAWGLKPEKHQDLRDGLRKIL